MQDLTLDELARIQQTLRNRFRAGKRGNVVDIAFGTATRNGELDPSRPNAVVFFVRKKHTPARRDRRIPTEVTVRLKRGASFETLRFPTDVIPYTRFAASARFVTRAGARLGSVGAVVCWRISPTAAWSWGLLTVAHLFRDITDLRGGQAVVSVVMPNGSKAFTGRLLVRTSSNMLIDAAVIEVSGQDLANQGVFLPVPEPLPEPYWTAELLKSAVAAANATGQPMPGVSFRPQGPVGFEVWAYLPKTDLVPELGSLRDMLFVKGVDMASPPAFVKETSGSIWFAAGLTATLQVAGDELSFTEGLGQVLEVAITWAAGAVRKQIGASELDFRFVRAF